MCNAQISGNLGDIAGNCENNWEVFFILLHLDSQGMLMIYIVGAILFLLQFCEGRGETEALKHVEIFSIFQIFKHVQYGQTI